MATEHFVTRRTALKFAGVITLAAHGWRISPGQAASLPARGYGTDPDRLSRPVTWPRTLDSTQLAVLAALCDIVLPAEPPHPSAAAIGIHDFLDEWVSAPYPQMRADRTIVLGGLVALEDTMRRESGVSFTQADLSQRTTVFDRLCSTPTTVEFTRRLI